VSAPALVLASGSPRRRDLLEEAGVRFEVLVPDVDETPAPGEGPAALAERLARSKAAAVRIAAEGGRWILAADTVVAIDDRVLGKPVDPADAVRMLSGLAGRRHRVYTGYALRCARSGELISGVVESHVQIRPLTAEQIAEYVASGEPLDKAGAYAAQGHGGRFIEAIEGSRSNVIGLPMETVLPLLRARGIAAR
jgi:septum formation protein